MGDMNTVSEIINKLRLEGYTIDFNLKENCLECQGNYLKIFPHEFKVDKHYRFEGDSNPGDEAIVYAISSGTHKVKGILVNGYGIYSEGATDEMIQSLK